MFGDGARRMLWKVGEGVDYAAAYLPCPSCHQREQLSSRLDCPSSLPFPPRSLIPSGKCVKNVVVERRRGVVASDTSSQESKSFWRSQKGQPEREKNTNYIDKRREGAGCTSPSHSQQLVRHRSLPNKTATNVETHGETEKSRRDTASAAIIMARSYKKRLQNISIFPAPPLLACKKGPTLCAATPRRHSFH
jgi:hypothetical protein